MKKKALILSIAILVVIGIFSFVNIFSVGQSFVKHTRFAEGMDDITDANFKKCVQKAMEGKQNLSEVTELNCSNEGITNVTGITNLTGLTSLNLSGNSITGAVDLVGMTALTSIDLSNNPRLASLKFYSSLLTSLKVNNTGIKDVDNIRVGENTLHGALGTKLATLGLEGIPWNDNMKATVLGCVGALENLSLANTGFNDTAFFTNNGTQFTEHLKTLDMSGNNLTETPLTGLKLTKFVCDNCGLTSITFDKTALVELKVPNNKLQSFYAYPTDYPALTKLDLSGNPLSTEAFDATPISGGTGVTELTLSNIKFERFNLAKLNPLHLTKLVMRNSNLTNDLDFMSFKELVDLDISNNSLEEANHPNNVSSLIFSFTSNGSADNSKINKINVSGNSGFSNIEVHKPEGVENDDEPSLPSLNKLDMSFTNNSNFDFEDLPNITDLNLVGCKNFEKLQFSEDEAENANRQKKLVSLGIAMSNLSLDDIPKGTGENTSLKTIIIDASKANILNVSSYGKLENIIVASEKEISEVTTADSLSTDILLSGVPSSVKNINAYKAYEGYSALDGEELTEIPVGKDKQVFFVAKNVDASVNGFTGEGKTVEYNGYFKVNPIKISSEKFKFDTLNNEKIIVVGDAEDGDIVDGVTISDQEVNASISEDGKYLVLSKNDTEVAKYRLVRVDPGSYTPENPDEGGSGEGSGEGSGGRGESELPDDDSGHSSLDPTEEPSGSGGEYETVDPTATGAFISIISLIVLVIAGVFSQYYMKKKRKEEELIEKI